jgi:NitT/TauT family transport system permease protein
MRRFRRELPALLAFVLFVAAWEAASHVFAIPKYLVPAPSVIVAAMVEAWGPILSDSGVTLMEAVVGLALSIVVSVPLGIIIVYSPVIERIVYPFLVASQAIPKVALAPIFVVWFGFGLLPKVLIAFFIAFFPIVVNTVVGMSRTPPEMIHLMRSLGASPAQILLRVRLVAAAPYIFAGIKIAAAFAVVGAIVGEFIAADKGLGYLQLLANNNMQIPLLFGTLVALSIMGILLFYVGALVEFVVLPKPLRQKRMDEGGATI